MTNLKGLNEYLGDLEQICSIVFSQRVVTRRVKKIFTFSSFCCC